MNKKDKKDEKEKSFWGNLFELDRNIGFILMLIVFIGVLIQKCSK